MQPDDNDNPHTYFARAEQAFASGDRRATGILLNQVLLREFTHKQTWRILHTLYGADQAFEVFQYKFTRQNYPNNLHLLTTIPEWISAVEPDFFTTDATEKPAPGSQPLPFHSRHSPASQTTRAKPPAVHQRIFPAVLFHYRGIFMLALLLLFMPVIYLLTGARNVKISAAAPANTSIKSTLTASSPEGVAAAYSEASLTPASSETLPVEPQNSTHQAALPDPLEFIHTYTNAINTHDYAAAWANLSPDFIEKMSAQLGHPYTYTEDYVADWNTVSSLEILAASTESSDSQSAVLLLKIHRTMTNGEAPVYNQRFHLVRAANINTWLIDAIETLK